MKIGKFSDILGQDDILARLRKNISLDNVTHSIAFCGPVGTGKKMTARIFAEALLCAENIKSDSDNGKTAPNERTPGGRTLKDPCGSCRQCRMLEQDADPDFYHVNAGNSSIGVEMIRDLQEHMLIKPVYAPVKVYIIEDAENLTPQAQNCLLKTLEDPPEYVVMILTVSNLNALIETVRSRIAVFRFKKIPADIIKALIEQGTRHIEHGAGHIEHGTVRIEDETGITPGEAEFIAAYSDGSAGAALEMVSSRQIRDIRDESIDVLMKIYAHDLYDALGCMDFFVKKKENAGMVLDFMALLLRDALMIRHDAAEKTLINTDKKDIIFNIASKLTSAKIMADIATVMETRSNLDRNAIYGTAIDAMIIRLKE
jgi:DNA polymerase III subunit delta'